MAACCGRAPTIRRVLGALQPAVIALCIAAALLAYFITFPNTSEGTCAVAPPGNATNDWLCIYIYSVAGATGVCAVLLLFMLGSLSWSRGSCYYLLAVLFLVVPFAGWIYGSVRVTQLGLDTNDLPGMTSTDYIFVPDHPRSYGWYLLPNQVDLRNTMLLAVLNQGQVNSCTANAAAAAMQYTVRRFTAGQRSFEASRLFLYYNARLMSGKRAANGLMPDAGSTLRACCKAVSHFGVAPEQLWPYQERMVAVQPSQEAYEAAKRNKGKFLYRKVPQDVYSLMAALRQGFPIVCALYYPKENKQGMDVGELPMPHNVSAAARSTWSAHAVLMVGYNWKRQTFLFQNSWSVDSGKKGYFNAPMALVLDPRMASDFWLFQPPGSCGSCASRA